MRCAICGADVRPSETSVPTSDGLIVHVVCADREATAAWLRRRQWAVVHTLVVAGAVGALLWVGPHGWLLALIAVGAIAHPLLHPRLWHYLIRNVDRWLRHRGKI